MPIYIYTYVYIYTHVYMYIHIYIHAHNCSGALHLPAIMLVQSRHFAAMLHHNFEAVLGGDRVRGPNRPERYSFHRRIRSHDTHDKVRRALAIHLRA